MIYIDVAPRSYANVIIARLQTSVDVHMYVIFISVLISVERGGAQQKMSECIQMGLFFRGFFYFFFVNSFILRISTPVIFIYLAQILHVTRDHYNPNAPSIGIEGMGPETGFIPS